MKLDRLLPMLLDGAPGRLRVQLALQAIGIRASAFQWSPARAGKIAPVKESILSRQGTASASELAAPVSPEGAV